jgi:glutathione S-transferase
MSMALEVGLLPSPALSDDAAKDVRRIVGLWNGLLTRFGGPWLLGQDWSIADAFYAPVASRLRTYQIDLTAYGDKGAAQAYADGVLADPAFMEWERAALKEGAGA